MIQTPKHQKFDYQESFSIKSPITYLRKRLIIFKPNLLALLKRKPWSIHTLGFAKIRNAWLLIRFVTELPS